MESSDSFGIYRKFGYCHARLLATHMSNITEMETELLNLDKEDEAGGEETNWRLKNRYHEEGLDTTKRELQQKMENELLAYGTHLPLLYLVKQHLNASSFAMILDTLLEKFGVIKSMSRTPRRDHDSVFKWLWANKPLDDNEFDWIFHPEDFVSLIPPRQNHFESFILSHLDGGSDSCFKVRMSFITYH